MNDISPTQSSSMEPELIHMPPEEINTYDLPSFDITDSQEKTQRFNAVGKNKRRRLFYKLYSFLSITIILSLLVFSTPEIIGFVMNDLGTQDMIVKRIFGSNALSGEKQSIAQLILNQSFGDLSLPNPDPSAPTPSTPNGDAAQTPPANTTPAPPSTTPSTPSVDQTTPDPTPTEPAENEKPIIQMDMSLLSYGQNYIYNDTSLSPDIEKLTMAELPSYYDASSGEPLVLIVHTHTTEAYMPEGALYYNSDGEIARSDSELENMIAVGREFARVLNENGINAIHCTVFHDESYRSSYQRSAETIKKYLAEYPSIKYVFDLHRDSLMRSNEELISAATSIDGENCAQIMPVVSAGFEGFEDNLTFALKLRRILNYQYTNLSRPVCLRESIYNQDLAPISVLLEIGTSGNSLSEAKRAATLTAEAVVKLIKG